MTVVAGAIAASGASAQQAPAKKPAYFASIAAAKARMRTGPGRNFPASWLYVRPDLPVRVVDAFQDWRKVEDPGGTTGWMLKALVSERRTAIVTAPQPIEMRDRPAGTRVAYRAAPGVVGRVSECGGGWCRFDVKGQAGYVEQRDLWGVEVGETLP
nr:SH3 domain-containing protein [Sphingomonas corticis]